MPRLPIGNSAAARGGEIETASLRFDGGDAMGDSKRDEAEIRRRIDSLVEVVRAGDLAAVMSFYAPEMVTFDIVPPLQKVGAAGKRKNWMDVFATYRLPLGYEVRDLILAAGDGVAFAHSLNRLSGALQNGREIEQWVRWTACFREIDGRWLIAHDHISVPTDFATGKALLDLRP
jgi:ketosteroid isomerase-like protein